MSVESAPPPVAPHSPTGGNAGRAFCPALATAGGRAASKLSSLACIAACLCTGAALDRADREPACGDAERRRHLVEVLPVDVRAAFVRLLVVGIRHHMGAVRAALGAAVVAAVHLLGLETPPIGDLASRVPKA